MRMECVESVDKTPNAYNCTASVHLKDNSLPDPDKWAEQFKKTVDQAYGFRGVEVSISGTVEAHDGVLAAPRARHRSTHRAWNRCGTSCNGMQRRPVRANPNLTSARPISSLPLREGEQSLPTQGARDEAS